MKQRIRLTESQLHSVIRRCINEALGDEPQCGWQCIAFMQDGGDTEAIEYFYSLYESDDESSMRAFCEDYDYGYSDEKIEENPRIANYDQRLYEDDDYLVLYNTTIGGALAIYRRACE